MILTSELEILSSINEAWLRGSLEAEANLINANTDTHMEVYNNRPNHFIIVVDDALKYRLDTTDYAATLTQQVNPFQDETLLVAIVDVSGTFEGKLANRVINTIYHTL